CREAKEALSNETATSVLALLPGRDPQEIRLTRTELEDLIRPRLVETVAALERTVASAGLEVDDLDRVLLVGGSSRMPLVGEIVADGVRAPLAIDTHPKHAIAQGAALLAARQAAAAAPPVTAPVAAAAPPEPPQPAPDLADLLPDPPTAGPVDDRPPPPRTTPPAAAPAGGGRGRVVVPFLLLAALVVAVALVANNRFGQSSDPPGNTTTSVFEASTDGDGSSATTSATVDEVAAADYRREAQVRWDRNQSLRDFLLAAPPVARNIGSSTIQFFDCQEALDRLEGIYLEDAARLDGAIEALPSHEQFPDIDLTSEPDIQVSYSSFRSEVLDFYVVCGATEEAPDVAGHPWFDAFITLQADLCDLGAVAELDTPAGTFECGLDVDRELLVRDLDAAFRPE
ncbi:MAG: Hsp70 family protein, partial [Actinomycetota bacterium]